MVGVLKVKIVSTPAVSSHFGVLFTLYGVLYTPVCTLFLRVYMLSIATADSGITST